MNLYFIYLISVCISGYNAVEMNASDDRSPEIFKNQLEAATQMQAVLGKSPKPNCLIIDEIDGAPAVSQAFRHFEINYLNFKLHWRIILYYCLFSGFD